MRKKKSGVYDNGMRKGILLVALGAIALFVAAQVINSDSVMGVNAGFNQYGYNYTARLFNGTGSGWCQAKGFSSDCMGIYSPDKLVMKWNAEWDRGNSEGWLKPPYGAWTDNEWNGKGVASGSGAVWHYKIIWVGPELTNSTYWKSGGYPIWGQFEVIMDQGQDPNIGPGHIWFAKATPAGYGPKP